MPNEFMPRKLHLSHLLPNVAGLVLVASGLTILVWVVWLTWYDMTSWGKDIALVFFGSRTGEAISLGIGMKVIHYLLIGLALPPLGLFTFLRRQSKAAKNLGSQTSLRQGKEQNDHSGCSHHFGYLAVRAKNAPIPQECLICPRIADCMTITVFIDKHAEPTL